MTKLRPAMQSPGTQGPLGNATTPAAKQSHWIIGGFFALLVHAAVAWPFLPPVAQDLGPVELEPIGPEIGVNLAPIVQPPPQEAPPPEPETEPETPAIEERADDSPPPSPPKEPRRIPDLPDIKPQAVPEIWTGSGSESGQMTLEEYLFLQSWLKAARQAVLERLDYPFEALQQALTGTANVIIVANSDGKITAWEFRQRTGYRILDREIERTIKSIRRLPKFPDGTRYDTLSYTVTIRFELVTPDGSVMAAVEVEEAREQAQQSVNNTGVPELSPAQISQCAATSTQLTLERDAIMVERERLEQARADYIEEVDRYQRQRRQPPRRVERLRQDYELDAEAFDARITQFNQQAEAYQGICSSGSTSYESYAQACRPYLASGNEYCQAYGNFWGRLLAE